MNHARLGVNIDHVATLRQARGEPYPSVLRAAELSLIHGADQITIHLREDRRHIQDSDLAVMSQVCSQYQKPLNLELSTAEELWPKIVETKPEWLCLVPERRLERTTEGGLNLRDKDLRRKIQKLQAFLKKHHVMPKISLFVEAHEEILTYAHELEVAAVEIHTGDYAKKFNHNEAYSSELQRFEECATLARKLNLGFHAGHGLTRNSLAVLLQQGLFQEYNIGHWIIAESLFDGLGNVVSQLKELIMTFPLKQE